MNKILTAEQLTMIRADVEAYLQNNRKLQPGPRDAETILQLLDMFDAERATVKILAEATTALLSRAEKAETELAAVLGVIDKVAFAGEVAEAEASFHKIENSVRTEYHTSEAPPIPMSVRYSATTNPCLTARRRRRYQNPTLTRQITW